MEGIEDPDSSGGCHETGEYLLMRGKGTLESLVFGITLGNYTREDIIKHTVSVEM